MSDRPQTTDSVAQTTPGQDQPPAKGLIHHSGFLDGVKSKLGGIADKGKELVHSQTVQHLASQAEATGQQILHSKRTGDLVQSVKTSGQTLYIEDKGHALKAVDAARKGNYAKAAQEALPLGEQAALGPTKIAVRVGTSAIASQLPPEQRKIVEVAGHGLPHVTLTGAVTDVALHQAGVNKPAESTTRTTQTAELAGHASDWIKKYGGKMFSKTGDQTSKQ